MNMFMLVCISISEGKGFYTCNDQVFEWLPILLFHFKFVRWYSGQSVKISPQKITHSKVKLTKTLPPPCILLPLITLWISNTFSAAFHEVRDTSRLLIRCFTVLCLCIHCMFVSVPRINVCVLLCAPTALFVSVKSRGTHAHTHIHTHTHMYMHTHTHTSQR